MVQTQRSGYETLNPKIQKYFDGHHFPRITAWGETPYQTVPLRRISSGTQTRALAAHHASGLQQYLTISALPTGKESRR